MRSTFRMCIFLSSIIFVVATTQPPRSSMAAPAFVEYLPLVHRADTSRIAYVASSIGCPCPLAIMVSTNKLRVKFGCRNCGSIGEMVNMRS
jgi:hypothetical protein